MERCPNCRARRSNDSSECHRCGMSFVLLLEIERQADQLQRIAADELLNSDWTEAKQHIQQIRQLKDSPILSMLERFIEAKILASETQRPLP